MEQVEIEGGRSNAPRGARYAVSTTVTFQLTPRSLWMWDERMRRVVEPGDFEIMTGPNSAQLQSTTLTVVLARTNP